MSLAQLVEGLHVLLLTMNSDKRFLSELHSLISMKSCLFSTMALPRLLPSSIILRRIRIIIIDYAEMPHTALFYCLKSVTYLEDDSYLNRITMAI